MPKGANGEPIGIPRNAFPASREFRLKYKSWDRGSSSWNRDAFHKDTQVIDDSEDEDDILFILSDDEYPPPLLRKEKENMDWKGKGKGKRAEAVIL